MVTFFPLQRSQPLLYLNHHPTSTYLSLEPLLHRPQQWTYILGPSKPDIDKWLYLSRIKFAHKQRNLPKFG